MSDDTSTPPRGSLTKVRYRAKITAKAQSPARLALGMTDTLLGRAHDTPQECMADIVAASHDPAFIHADVVEEHDE